MVSNQFTGFRNPQISYIKASTTNEYVCGTTTGFQFPWCFQRCFASDTNMVTNYLIDMLTRWIYNVLRTQNKCFLSIFIVSRAMWFYKFAHKKYVWRCSSRFCNKASTQPKRTNIHDTKGHCYTEMRHIIGAWYNAWYDLRLLFSVISTSTICDSVMFL